MHGLWHQGGVDAKKSPSKPPVWGLEETLDPTPSSSFLLSSLELSDTQVYEPYTRALLGTPPLNPGPSSSLLISSLELSDTNVYGP